MIAYISHTWKVMKTATKKMRPILFPALYFCSTRMCDSCLFVIRSPFRLGCLPGVVSCEKALCSGCADIRFSGVLRRSDRGIRPGRT